MNIFNDTRHCGFYCLFNFFFITCMWLFRLLKLKKEITTEHKLGRTKFRLSVEINSFYVDGSSLLCFLSQALNVVIYNSIATTNFNLANCDFIRWIKDKKQSSASFLAEEKHFHNIMLPPHLTMETVSG